MKNVTMIVLAVLLGVAVISGLLLYGKYRDVKKELVISDNELSSLNEKLGQLNGEMAKLNDQIRGKDERLEELEEAKHRISQLEDVKTVKEQAISRLEEKLRALEGDLRAEKRAQEAIRRELSARDKMVAKLKGQLHEEKSLGQAELDELRSTYDSLVSELKEQVKDKEMTIREFEERLAISFVDRILFDFGKATITSEGRGVLAKVGEILKNASGMKIRVVGHTDNVPIAREFRGRYPSNWDLSSARAAAVVRYLQKEGDLDPKDLEAVGRSFYEPVATNDTEGGRAQNRRVEVIIAPKMKKRSMTTPS
jgi:chemotaxis protein MotB